MLLKGDQKIQNKWINHFNHIEILKYFPNNVIAKINIKSAITEQRQMNSFENNITDIVECHHSFLHKLTKAYMLYLLSIIINKFEINCYQQNRNISGLKVKETQNKLNNKI